VIAQTSTTHRTDCGCDECGSARRNRFFRGKRMGAEEFLLEQTYGIGRRRLVNRALAGWGVVYGFSVRQDDPPDPRAFKVGPGLALDRHGREIELRSPAVLGPGNTVIARAGDERCKFQPIEQAERNGVYLLKAHYAERPFGLAPSPDDCGCEDAQHNYVCEDVLFTLTRLEEGKCPCEERKCRRKCTCRPKPKRGSDDQRDADSERSRQQTAAQANEPEPVDWRQDRKEHDSDDGQPEHDRRPCGCRGRGPHACLCEWSAAALESHQGGVLCEWKGLHVDPLDGVALACVRVWTTEEKRGDKTCTYLGVELVEGCDPRRIVKSNDLLYDLIRGCDLTRISHVSWHDWHRSSEEVEWADFAKMFTAVDSGDGRPQVKSNFIIRFSGPVREDTIARDAIVLTAITMDPDSGWRVPRRIPIARIDKTPTREMPEGHTDQVQLYVSHRWYADEIKQDSHSWLSGRGFALEIEIHGDLILDCHCQAVDANAVGLDAAPTGNGTPGGTYRSSFWVKPRRDDHWKDSEAE
jgi:hypothetical protein